MARRKRKRPARSADTVAGTLESLGCRPEDWTVSIHFTKGVVSGGRGAVVEVTHRASGRVERGSRPAGTKRRAQARALELVRELVERMKR
ncbi:MAG: hypothetical protein AAF533_15895 [Acidobacteriota bacterium]